MTVVSVLGTHQSSSWSCYSP